MKPESLLAPASSSYQYGSLMPSPEEETLDNAPRRRGSRRPFCTGMASALLAFGLFLWIGMHVVEYKGMQSGFFLDSDWGDDDYSYEYEYDSHSSLFQKLLPDNIPLLGRSHHVDPQGEANNHRDFLYSDPELQQRNHKNNKRQKTEIMGSSVPVDTGDLHAEEGCEGTVIIMRHCEKGTIREHCNYMGYERSAYLTTLFGDNARWPAPSYIFAEAPGARRNPQKMNFREVETVLPLAEKFNLTVDTSFSTLETTHLARKVQGMMRSGEMCGKLIVISWKHSKVPHMAQFLGCGPLDGCPIHYKGNDFDHLWQLKFVYRTPFHSSRKHLKAPKESEWAIYGSVQPENFDPLAFSKTIGDYPPGGTKTGGRWRAFDHEIPEREDFDEKTKKKHKWFRKHHHH